jgi:hypothetical protein
VHVAQGIPAITLQPRSDEVGTGDETSVTAILTSTVAATNAPAPTGTVQFFDAVDGRPARAIGAPQAVVGANGGALLATLASTLPRGENLITAIYSGDANWKSTVSAPVRIRVRNGRD